MNTDIAKNAQNSMRGRRSRAEGEWFERVIEIAGSFYEDRGIAVLDKTPEPMRVIRPMGNGQFLARFEKMAQPDFKGTLCDGTTILFDAKHTETDRLRRNVVTSEQERCFERYSSMGARCFVVAGIRFLDFFRVPWDVFRDMKKIYGHQYMTLEELEEYRVLYRGGILRFLDGIEITDREEEMKDGN